MPRDRTRATLDAGTRLSLARVTLQPGTQMEITWKGGLEVAGYLRLGRDDGQLRLIYDGREQLIWLNPVPRHLGGVQWYFVCPRTNKRASVLWRPPGASFFASRHAWNAVYYSQSIGSIDRAWHAKRRVAKRLGSRDPHDYELPEKPRWMRWATYDRYVEAYNRAEQRLDEGLLEALQSFLRRF